MAHMTVKNRKDVQTPRYVMHKVADIRGGVSVATSELGGDFLREGAILSAPDSNGIAHVVKTAEVVADAAATDTSIKISKFHNFKVGDIVMAELTSVAEAISAIDESNKNYDKITVASALGAISKGSSIAQAAETSTNASKLKYEPQAVNGTGQPVDPKSNLSTDAWVIGVTKKNPIPDFIGEKLKGIINL